MHIPAVMNVIDVTLDILSGREVLVDGTEGRVVVGPDAQQLAGMRRRRQAERTRSAGLDALRDEPAVTLDGTLVALQANVGLSSDAADVQACGAVGVGLYRSEFAFMMSESFPSEGEQVATYR